VAREYELTTQISRLTSELDSLRKEHAGDWGQGTELGGSPYLMSRRTGRVQCRRAIFIVTQATALMWPIPHSIP
jgi:hypothetical protein